MQAYVPVRNFGIGPCGFMCIAGTVHKLQNGVFLAPKHNNTNCNALFIEGVIRSSATHYNNTASNYYQRDHPSRYPECRSVCNKHAMNQYEYGIN